MNGWILFCIAIAVLILNLRLIVLLPSIEDGTGHVTTKTVQRQLQQQQQKPATKERKFVDSIDRLEERVENLERSHRSYMQDALNFLTESKQFQQISFAATSTSKAASSTTASRSSTSTTTTTSTMKRAIPAPTAKHNNNNNNNNISNSKNKNNNEPESSNGFACQSNVDYLATVGAPHHTLTANCFTQQKAYYDNEKAVEAVANLSFLILPLT